MHKLIAGYSCAACQIAGWFGGMSLRPVGMLYVVFAQLASSLKALMFPDFEDQM